MEEVTCRPTNMEVDDYAEYKRLRKIHREHKRKGPGSIPMPQQVLKAAPPIPPLQLPASPTIAPQSLLRVSPSVSRQTTFKEPAFDAPKAFHEVDRLPTTDLVSPMTVPGLQESFFAPKKVGTLAIPSLKDKSKHSLANSSDTSREKHARVLSPGSSSLASSTKSGHSDLKEIIPWIDLEAELPTPPFDTPPVVEEQMRSQSMERLEVKAAEMNPVKNVRRLARDSRQPSDLSLRSQNAVDKDTVTNALNLRLYSTKPMLPMLGKKKGKEAEKEKEKKKKPTFGKRARFFDGAGYSADEEDDNYQAISSKSRRFRSSSVDDLPQLHSRKPIRPSRPLSLLDYGIEDIEFASPLDNLISRPRMATPVNSFMSPPMANSGGPQVTGGESVALGRLKRWLSK